MPSCIVKGCKSRSLVKEAGVSFHEFPKDPARRARWVSALGKPSDWQPPKTATICSKHFRPGHFDTLFRERIRLYPHAVPVILQQQESAPRANRRCRKEPTPDSLSSEEGNIGESLMPALVEDGNLVVLESEHSVPTVFGTSTSSSPLICLSQPQTRLVPVLNVTPKSAVQNRSADSINDAEIVVTTGRATEEGPTTIIYEMLCNNNATDDVTADVAASVELAAGESAAEREIAASRPQYRPTADTGGTDRDVDMSVDHSVEFADGACKAFATDVHCNTGSDGSDIGTFVEHSGNPIDDGREAIFYEVRYALPTRTVDADVDTVVSESSARVSNVDEDIGASVKHPAEPPSEECGTVVYEVRYSPVRTTDANVGTPAGYSVEAPANECNICVYQIEPSSTHSSDASEAATSVERPAEPLGDECDAQNSDTDTDISASGGHAAELENDERGTIVYELQCTPGVPPGRQITDSGPPSSSLLRTCNAYTSVGTPALEADRNNRQCFIYNLSCPSTSWVRHTYENKSSSVGYAVLALNDGDVDPVTFEKLVVFVRNDDATLSGKVFLKGVLRRTVDVANREQAEDVLKTVDGLVLCVGAGNREEFGGVKLGDAVRDGGRLLFSEGCEVKLADTGPRRPRCEPCKHLRKKLLARLSRQKVRTTTPAATKVKSTMHSLKRKDLRIAKLKDRLRAMEEASAAMKHAALETQTYYQLGTGELFLLEDS